MAAPEEAHERFARLSSARVTRQSRKRHGMCFFSRSYAGVEGPIDDTSNQEKTTMLGWAITFLVIALIAAVLGFGGVAGTAAGIAKILFVVFLILFVVSLLFGRRAPSV